MQNINVKIILRNTGDFEMSFLIFSIIVLNHNIFFLFIMQNHFNFHAASRGLKQDYLSECSTRNRKLTYRLAHTVIPANATGQHFRPFGYLEGCHCGSDTVTEVVYSHNNFWLSCDTLNRDQCIHVIVFDSLYF